MGYLTYIPHLVGCSNALFEAFRKSHVECTWCLVHRGTARDEQPLPAYILISKAASQAAGLSWQRPVVCCPNSLRQQNPLEIASCCKRPVKVMDVLASTNADGRIHVVSQNCTIG